MRHIRTSINFGNKFPEGAANCYFKTTSYIQMSTGRLKQWLWPYCLPCDTRRIVCGDWARSRHLGILLSFLRGWWGNTAAFRGQHGILTFQNVFSLNYFMLVNGKFTLFTHTHTHTHTHTLFLLIQSLPSLMTVVSESQMLSWLVTNSDD